MTSGSETNAILRGNYENANQTPNKAGFPCSPHDDCDMSTSVALSAANQQAEPSSPSDREAATGLTHGCQRLHFAES